MSCFWKYNEIERSVIKMPKINLTKNGTLVVDLNKENQKDLDEILIGLGWEVNVFHDADFDLDVSAFLVNASGRVRSVTDFIYYKHLNQDIDAGLFDIDGSGVVHMGDNRKGDAMAGLKTIDGITDSEQIIVNWSHVPSDIKKIVFVVTIYDAVARNQNFGQVSNAYVRVIDMKKKEVLAQFDLPQDYETDTAITVGELSRVQGGWAFKALGIGEEKDLGDLCKRYGLRAN